MAGMDWELEELARKTLEGHDIGTPVDPDVVASELELEVQQHEASDGLLVGRKIIVCEALRAQRRAFAIAHEIGHWLLRLHGLRDTEQRASYLASALLLPRGDFERDLKRIGWDLLHLRARYQHASFEAVARRIVALRDARAFVFDKPLRGQREPSVYSVPWGHRPGPEERLAAREAAVGGAPVELLAELTAWPVIEHDWIRVITVRAL